MSHVQFDPAVSDDIRLAQQMLIGGEWVGEEYLETKTVVVSL